MPSTPGTPSPTNPGRPRPMGRPAGYDGLDQLGKRFIDIVVELAGREMLNGDELETVWACVHDPEGRIDDHRLSVATRYLEGFLADSAHAQER